MRNDGASSSHRGRGVDEWRPENDRYDQSPSKDSYRRGGRDDYGPRDTDPYGRDYPSNRQYSDPYDDDRGPTTSYMDSSGRSPPGHDDRDLGWSRWTPKDNRQNHRNDRARGNFDFNDRHKDNGRKEESSQFKERRRDNGWASRRRNNPEPTTTTNANAIPLGGGEPPSNDDRNGEPSGSLQPNNNGRSEGQRKKHKKKKKNQNDKRNNRDWRNDDGHLNNWQKRDGGGGSNKNQRPIRKPQRRSPSRSRSRSPADSYYSRRSSRGRSRSRSIDSLRYRRRGDSRPPRSRSPVDRWSDRDRGGRPSRRYTPTPSPSPPRRYRSSRSPPPRRDRSWARTPSTRTSYSRSRSRSRTRSHSRSVTPERDRPRPVHRLPTATSLEDVRGWVDVPKSPPRGRFQQRNGDGQPKLTKAERKAQRKAEKEREKEKEKGKAAELLNDSKSMPPPLPPSSANGSGSREPPSSLPPRPESPLSTRAAGKPKNAGFKPIGQPNASLKRFFPGDEDDELELAPQRSSTSSAQVSQTSAVTAAQNHFISSSGTQEVTRAELNVHSQQNGKHVHSSRIEIHSAQRPGSLQDTQNQSHIPTPATPSPASQPPRHYSANDHRAHYDANSPRLPPYPHPVDVPQHVKRMMGQHPHTPDQRAHYDVNSPRPSPYSHATDAKRMVGQHPHTPAMTRPPTPEKANEELYAIVSQVGEGTFGKVYKARNTATGKFMALKRIRMEAERDGFPVTAMREIKLLQSLRHENVVRLYEMMVSNGSVFMVFEYMDHDLTGILSQTQFTFNSAHLKSLCQQMLAGLAYLHHKGVIHRDIKGSNILVNNRGELKLADFGLARFYQKRRRSDYTNRVITLWYRPPELLFGTTVYGPEVDMWSAGCIMLELFTKKPIFQGNDEIHQLDVMYRILGTPTPERWPGVNSLPWYELVKPKDVIPNHFKELFQKWLSPAALDLAEQLLAYDPAQRATAAQALEAPYFNQEQPAAEPPVGLATLEGEWHELETKRERAKKRRKTEGSGTTQ